MSEQDWRQMEQDEREYAKAQPSALDKSATGYPVLGPKHQGMRVSAEGVLGRIRDGRSIVKGHRFMAGELLRHLNELATRYYAGDALVVDEFLQFYCLDEKRPNTTPSTPDAEKRT